MNLLLPLSLITSSSHFAGNLFGVINHNTSCDTPCHISLLADALMQQSGSLLNVVNCCNLYILIYANLLHSL